MQAEPRLGGMSLAEDLLNGEVRDARVIRIGVRDWGILLDYKEKWNRRLTLMDADHQ
jgi:hypothetical protein